MVKDNRENLGECTSSCQPIQVPTEDELTALNALRTIKDRVREIKTRLSEISPANRDEDAKEVLDLEKEMARLKQEWKDWEKRRDMAAKERMILLGHEEAS